MDIPCVSKCVCMRAGSFAFTLNWQCFLFESEEAAHHATNRVLLYTEHKHIPTDCVRIIIDHIVLLSVKETTKRLILHTVSISQCVIFKNESWQRVGILFEIALCKTTVLASKCCYLVVYSWVFWGSASNCSRCCDNGWLVNSGFVCFSYFNFFRFCFFRWLLLGKNMTFPGGPSKR